MVAHAGEGIYGDGCRNAASVRQSQHETPITIAITFVVIEDDDMHLSLAMYGGRDVHAGFPHEPYVELCNNVLGTGTIPQFGEPCSTSHSRANRKIDHLLDIPRLASPPPSRPSPVFSPSHAGIRLAAAGAAAARAVFAVMGLAAAAAAICYVGTQYLSQEESQ